MTPHFKLSEFACRCGCGLHADVKYRYPLTRLAEALEVIRGAAGGGPLGIQSGFRCPAHNAKQPGAAPRSLHMQGRAADLRASHVRPTRLAEIIEGLIQAGKVPEGGIGIYDNFVHYDTRSLIGMRAWRSP